MCNRKSQPKHVTHCNRDSKKPQDTGENEHNQNSLFSIHISQPKHVGTQKKCLYNEKLPRAPKTHVKYVKTDGNLTLIDLYLFNFIPERIINTL